MDFKNNNDFLLLFEKRLSEYTGAPYVVLTSSCTNSIMLMLKYLKSTEAVIPSRTYLSVAQLLHNENINFEYSDKPWVGSYHICDNIYDYAVGFKKDMYVPGQYQCLSFQQKKTLNIGKGGAILLDSYEDYKILKRMAHDGRDGSVSTSSDIENIILGYHVYMSPDEAAKGVLLLNQLLDRNIIIGSSDDYPDISGIKYD